MGCRDCGAGSTASAAARKACGTDRRRRRRTAPYCEVRLAAGESARRLTIEAGPPPTVGARRHSAVRRTSGPGAAPCSVPARSSVPCRSRSEARSRVQWGRSHDNHRRTDHCTCSPSSYCRRRSRRSRSPRACPTGAAKTGSCRDRESGRCAPGRPRSPRWRRNARGRRSRRAG